MSAQGSDGESLRASREVLCASTTREASDHLLGVLRDGRWRPAAWGRFAALTALRSFDAARAHPRAFLQSTAIHLPFLLAARRRPAWVLSSWVLAVTHLGMVGERDGLGVANTLTLVRANLPSLADRLGPALPVLSLATDFADGRIARGPGRVTAFGAQADFIADAALWTWFVARHDPSRVVLIATIAAWVTPIAGLAVAGAVRGRITDLPRSAWLRPAAALEVIIGARAVLRYARVGARGRRPGRGADR